MIASVQVDLSWGSLVKSTTHKAHQSFKIVFLVHIVLNHGSVPAASVHQYCDILLLSPEVYLPSIDHICSAD